MTQKIDFSTFCDGFTSSDIYNTKYSYGGLRALFNYFEELEDSTGEPIEFDRVAIACDYTEYASLEDLQKDYPNIESMEQLNEKTTVIEVDDAMKTGAFIIANF